MPWNKTSKTPPAATGGVFIFTGLKTPGIRLWAIDKKNLKWKSPAWAGLLQRSGGDSNPRYCLTQYVHLANGCFQPLSHRSKCCVPPKIPAHPRFVNTFFRFCVKFCIFFDFSLFFSSHARERSHLSYSIYTTLSYKKKSGGVHIDTTPKKQQKRIDIRGFKMI